MTAVVLPHAAASAAVARRSLIAELTSAGMPRSVVGDAALVLSELVGNAVRHAGPLPGGALRAEWSFEADSIEIAVTDGGSGEVPRAVDADDGATGGRGLSIVEALSRAWGTRRDGRGLRVWAKVPCSAGTRAPGAGDDPCRGPRLATAP